MSLRRLNNGGDTIIEIMVVLAVLGMAIGISYATASRSLLAARAAQENSEATQLVQAQVEYLRNFAKNPPGDSNDIFLKPPTYPASQLFCIDTTAGAVVAPASFTGPLSPSTIYPAACQQGTPNRYQLAISHDNSPDAVGNPVDNFTVTATWDDVQGQGQDTATVVYRVHYIP
jgi:type II secretory pathway pseudopilin PulG